MTTTASISSLVVQYRRCEGLSALLQYATSQLPVVLDLTQNPPSPQITGIRIKNIVQSLLEKPESGRLSVKHAKPEKQPNTGIPHKRHIFPRQMHQWRSDIGKLRDKTPVVSHESQKLSHTLQTVWGPAHDFTSSIFFGSHSKPRRPTI